jgi:hypothetical protein
MQIFIDGLMCGGIPFLSHFLSLSLFFLFLSVGGDLFVEAAEKRMFLGSPFIGDNLVQVPCQDEVEDDIEEEASKSIPDDVVVQIGRKGRSHLAGLGVYHGLECDNESCMGDDA